MLYSVLYWCEQLEPLGHIHTLCPFVTNSRHKDHLDERLASMSVKTPRYKHSVSGIDSSVTLSAHWWFSTVRTRPTLHCCEIVFDGIRWDVLWVATRQTFSDCMVLMALLTSVWYCSTVCPTRIGWDRV